MDRLADDNVFSFMVLDEPDLQIPHVEMHKRDFVLTPLAEIAPWVRHPLTKQTVAEMQAADKPNL